MQFFKYKYREGRIRNQGEILKELPYDMQVGMSSHKETRHWPRHACLLPTHSSYSDRPPLMTMLSAALPFAMLASKLDTPPRGHKPLNPKS